MLGFAVARRALGLAVARRALGFDREPERDFGAEGREQNARERGRDVREVRHGSRPSFVKPAGARARTSHSGVLTIF